MKKLSREQRGLIRYWVDIGFFPYVNVFPALMFKNQTRAFLESFLEKDKKGWYNPETDGKILNGIRSEWIEHLRNEGTR